MRGCSVVKWMNQAGGVSGLPSHWFAAAGLLIGTATFGAAAQGYEFATIADTAEGFESFGRVTINNLGQVALRAADASGDGAIYRGDGVTLTLIANEAQVPGFFGFNPDINDAGAVSFAVNVSGPGEKIFRGAGAGLTTIAGTDPDVNGDFNFFGFDTSINNAGMVAFSAELDTFDLGVFAGTGGSAAVVFTSGGGQFTGSFDRPAINDAGQVAFFTFLPSSESAIYRADGGQVFTLIADSNGEFAEFAAPDLNGVGDVAFLTRHDDFSTAGIYVGDGATLTLIADNLGQFDDLDAPSINDDGDVAFRAYYPTGGTSDPFFEGGILVNGVVVIETGDPIAGSTIENLIFRQGALNNRGEVAFVAQLADGRMVVVRGTPAEQGEPATLTDFSVTFGSLVSGGLAELMDSDNAWLRTRSIPGFTAEEANLIEIRIGAQTPIVDPATLDLTLEGRLNQPGGTVRVRLRNWNTNAFVQVHQYSIGFNESIEMIDGIDATNRVRASDGRIQLSLRQSVFATFSALGFDSFTDEVVIGVR